MTAQVFETESATIIVIPKSGGGVAASEITAQTPDGTYVWNGRKYMMPKGALELAALWNQGLKSREIEDRIDEDRYDVIGRVSQLRQVLPEMFPYRGSVQQKNGGAK